MNTRINYEYTDGANYHFRGSLVVKGRMTKALARILKSCNEGDQFIADQVGFPEVFGYLPGKHVGDKQAEDTGYPYDEENDHCWHRFAKRDGDWELTKARWEQVRSVEEVVASFEKAATEGWKVFDPADRFGV